VEARVVVEDALALSEVAVDERARGRAGRDNDRLAEREGAAGEQKSQAAVRERERENQRERRKANAQVAAALAAAHLDRQSAVAAAAVEDGRVGRLDGDVDRGAVPLEALDRVVLELRRERRVEEGAVEPEAVAGVAVREGPAKRE